MNLYIAGGKRLVLSLVFASFGLAGSANAQVIFTDLGTRAHDVSDDGSVVVGYDAVSAYNQFYPIYVAGDGSATAGSDGITGHGYWRSQSGFSIDLGSLPGKGTITVRGISGDGSVVIGTATGLSGSESFRWTAATGMVPLGAPGYALALADNGQVATGFSSGTAFRWSQTDGYAALDPINIGLTIGYGLNRDGSIIVGALAPAAQYEAFRWTKEEGIVGLGKGPGFISTIALGVSDDGSTVIGDGTTGGGFIWTPESGLRHLLDVVKRDYGLADQLSGWTNLIPSAISPDGRFIVGNGVEDGMVSGWLLDRGLDPIAIAPPPLMSPVPEPATYGWAAVLLLLGLTIKQRSRRHALTDPPGPLSRKIRAP